MRNVFSFCNQKGGVGKTTSVVNIAAVLASKGLKTLVIDMDSQANATSGFGHEKPSIESTTYQLIVENLDPRSLIRKTEIKNLELIPSNSDLAGIEIELLSMDRREFLLKCQLEKIKGEYDFVFIDCPPSLGLATVNSLCASDYVIIPLQCEYYALEGLGQLVRTYQLIQKNLNPGLEIGGVILTMTDFRANLTHQVAEEVKKFFKDKVFPTSIPRSVRISESPSFGKPAVIYDPSNRGSKSYEQLGEEFIQRFSRIKPDEKMSSVTETQNNVVPPAASENLEPVAMQPETANQGETQS